MKNIQRRLKVKKGIRKRISGTLERPRITVYRSNTSIYAQIVDDDRSVTLAYFASNKIKTEQKLTKVQASYEVGKQLGEIAKSKGIEKAVFDRNGFRYHGRVKALAEGVRSAGLDF